MSSAAINSGQDIFSIDWVFDGDYVVQVRVTSSDFSGCASGHVFVDNFESFRRDIIELEKNRRGEARLEAVYEREFSVVVEATDRLGHMAIRGNLSALHNSPNGTHENSLKFSFEFDPSELEKFAHAIAV